MELHISYHVIETLVLIYLIIAQHQTRQMLIHMARTISSVNDHLDSLIKLSKEEIEREKHALESDFPSEFN